MRLKPGDGWKQLSVPVWENAARGVRIHTSGLVCDASGKDILCWCSMWPHSAEWQRHTLIAGGNLKRGLMTLAMDIAGKVQS